MLIIRSEQMDAMSDYMNDSFIKRSVEFLKNERKSFAQNHSDEEIKTFVDSMIKFSQECDVKKEGHMQDLMILKIDYAFDIPLSEENKAVLQKKDFSEYYRVDSFRKWLESDQRLIRITLDTPI